jgi:hypothetical protein
VQSVSRYGDLFYLVELTACGCRQEQLSHELYRVDDDVTSCNSFNSPHSPKMAEALRKFEPVDALHISECVNWMLNWVG